MTTIAVLTTTDSRDEARRISEALVELGLAACAQISEIESVYEWQGRIQRDTEFRLFVKTTRERYDAVERAIRERHSYDLPAIYAIELDRVYAPYADWVASNSGGELA
jgi:periplasmic divalent cation tolerance protein